MTSTMKWAVRRRLRLAGMVGAFFGSALPFVTPDAWWNLAFVPWYAAWVTLPSMAIVAGACLLLRIDFISDAAPVVLLQIMLMLACALVGSLYGLLLSMLVGISGRYRLVGPKGVPR